MSLISGYGIGSPPRIHSIDLNRPGDSQNPSVGSVLEQAISSASPLSDKSGPLEGNQSAEITAIGMLKGLIVLVGGNQSDISAINQLISRVSEVRQDSDVLPLVAQFLDSQPPSVLNCPLVDAEGTAYNVVNIIDALFSKFPNIQAYPPVQGPFNSNDYRGVCILASFILNTISDPSPMLSLLKVLLSNYNSPDFQDGASGNILPNTFFGFAMSIHYLIISNENPPNSFNSAWYNSSEGLGAYMEAPFRLMLDHCCAVDQNSPEDISSSNISIMQGFIAGIGVVRSSLEKFCNLDNPTPFFSGLTNITELLSDYTTVPNYELFFRAWNSIDWPSGWFKPE